jgi:hypothetical protein
MLVGETMTDLIVSNNSVYDKERKQIADQLTAQGFNPDEVKIKPRGWNPGTFPRRDLPNYLKFDPVLYQFFKRVHYDDKNFIAVVVGETGCQPGSDKVLMSTGRYKLIKNIVAGDKVISFDKKFNKIVSKVKTVNAYRSRKIFDLMDDKKVLYSCTEYHKIPVFVNNVMKFVEAGKLRIGVCYTTIEFINGGINFVKFKLRLKRRVENVFGLDILSKTKLYVTNFGLISHNSGKSITALTLARAIDITPLGNGRFRRNFVLKVDDIGRGTPDTRVVFGPSDFLRLVKSGLPKGSVIVWDEAGIGQDATTWQDKKSRLIKHIMQTFRSRNYGLFMTVPDKESITLATRRLVHCYIDVTKRDDHYAYLDIRWLNRVRGNEKTETYYKYPVFKDPLSGKLKKIVRYKVPKIDMHTERIYNRIKDTTLQYMYTNYHKELELMEKELGETNLVEKAVKLKKFNMAACSEIAKYNINDCRNDDGSFTEAKIMLTLSKNGYDCNKQNAKLLGEILREYDAMNV